MKPFFHTIAERRNQVTKSRSKKSLLGPIHVCGGTLIDSDIVVTAAECLYNLSLLPNDPWITRHTYTRASRLKITRNSEEGAAG